MAARKHPAGAQLTRPGLTVLQLDTAFPRVPGDVACPETYACEIEVIRIPRASVAAVVRSDPGAIDIAPFEAALARARGDVVTTSCGFLAPWQAHLQGRLDRPFVASALGALGAAENLLTVTFDAQSLGAAHVPAGLGDVVGLDRTMHLRQVIAEDREVLDEDRAGQELVDLIAGAVKPDHQGLLFECTNLPPYKAQVRAQVPLSITDILTEIERLGPGTVRPVHL